MKVKKGDVIDICIYGYGTFKFRIYDTENEFGAKMISGKPPDREMPGWFSEFLRDYDARMAKSAKKCKFVWATNIDADKKEEVQ